MEGTRKLAAILVADVSGYSRLMGDDEAATVRTLTEYRQVFADHSARHGGRIVDTAGDSVLAVFDSAVEAVECAAEIQTTLARRNRQLAEHRRMQFRIGVNLGDVISRGDGTVYGDGVNIAARLETLAAAGGLCVSGSVYDHVEGKVLLAFTFAGVQSVKNIAKPIRAYQAVIGSDAAVQTPVPRRAYDAVAERVQAASKAATTPRQDALIATLASLPSISAILIVLVVLAGAAAVWIWARSGADRIPASMRRATIQLAGHGDPRGHYYGLYEQTSWFALSGDGLLVYAGQAATDAMLSRRLDEPTPRPVDGTTHGTTPFLSPDGKTLGFERDNEMFVVSMSGGPSTRVTGALFWEWGGRPAWTPDDRIVYTSNRGGLVMVRPDGTSSEQLTTPAEGTRHLSPLVLPDGHAVLFTEITGNVSAARIVALSLDDRHTRTLVSGGALTPQYADGFLFYCRSDGALMAAPFDPASVELSGAARALPDRVDRSRFGVAHYAAAPGVLLYAPVAQTRLVEIDAKNAVTALTEEGRWHMPRYSPDGTRIVFDNVTGETGERDVWTLSRVDKTLSRLTRIGDAHDPTWLPNGNEVSFLSFSSPGGPLMIAAADGSGEPHPVRAASTFTFPRALLNPGVWLPDGSAYLGGVVERGTSDIWRLPRDRGPAVQLVGGPADEHSPSVSADGRWLAYQSNETGRPEVYVRPLAGPEGRLQVSSAGATAPVWDRHGLKLYYLEADGTRLHLTAASLKTTPALSVVARTVVLTDVRLQEAENHPQYDVAPSGTTFVMPEQAPAAGLSAIFDLARALRSTAFPSK